jgi:FkbM family methyltransferase
MMDKAVRAEYLQTCKDLNLVESVDKTMIKECYEHYYDADYKGQVCLDLGSNVGGFMKIALDKGAEKVIAVECDPRNFINLVHNFGGQEPAVELINKAVTSQEKDRDLVQIFKSNSKFNHCSTSIVNKVRFNEYDEVIAVGIRSLLEEYQPDIVKVDVEGAEYEILEDIIDYAPETLFVEFHYTKKTLPLGREFIRRLSEMYNASKVKDAIAFNKVRASDCMFTS